MPQRGDEPRPRRLGRDNCVLPSLLGPIDAVVQIRPGQSTARDQGRPGTTQMKAQKGPAKVRETLPPYRPLAGN